MNFFTHIDPAKNVARFWLSIVTPTLLGDWSLIREWGRIGSPGRMESRTFDHEDEARRAEQCGIKKRELHGYQPTPDVVARWAEVMAAVESIKEARRGSKIKFTADRYSENAKQGVLDFPNTSQNLL